VSPVQVRLSAQQQLLANPNVRARTGHTHGKVRGSYAHLRVEVRHHLDGSISVHLPGGKQIARSAAGAAMRFRPKGQTRAPVGGVRPDPRNVDRSHPWRQWRPGQFRGGAAKIPRSELA